MAVLSVLRSINKLRPTLTPLKSFERCSSGHDRTIVIRPSYFAWRVWKNWLHFYFWLGVGPLTLITSYANIVIGNAELTEIPEGYEPYDWEYEKNPVSRFYRKYCTRDKRIDYEMLLCYINEESEKMILKRIESYVQHFMSLRSDYKSWYYRPVYGYLHRIDREKWKYLRDNLEGGQSWYKDEHHIMDLGQPDHGE